MWKGGPMIPELQRPVALERQLGEGGGGRLRCERREGGVDLMATSKLANVE